MDKKAHWETVYQTKGRDEVSWFREHLDLSLELIRGTGVEPDAGIIDVGGGNSNLVDDLLLAGFADVSVLDISGKAVSDSKERLGVNSDNVVWIEGDITEAELSPDRYEVWHDRAVFHFLTDDEDRRRYIAQVLRSVKPGGHVIVASFGLEGPKKCSGLNVVRYSPDSMHNEFGDEFALINSVSEEHNTPFGTTQQFVYCYCRRTPSR